MKAVHPEDREFAGRKWHEAVSNATPFHEVFRLRKADGGYQWTSVRAAPLRNPDGSIKKWVGINVNVHARKQAEEALVAAHRQIQNIIDNTTSIIYAFDLEERFLLVNTALADLFNSTPEQMIGKRRHEFMPKDDADWHEENDHQAIETGRSLEFEEYSQLKDRSITWLTTKFPLRDAQGRIYAVGGISTDITVRKQAEEEMQKFNERLEQQVAERTAEAEHRAEALRQLALELSGAEDLERRRIANILHDDLQQYLAAIRFRLDGLFPDGINDPGTAERVASVESLLDESIQKCRNLSHELFPPVLQQNGLLSALDWLARSKEERYGLKVELHVDPEAEPDSPKLAAALFRSVRELLFNIVKHADTDRAELRIKSENGCIQISVSDHGKGFDMDKFRRRRREYRAGYGLFTIEERIQFMGGSFKIESAPGAGCRINIEVPNIPHPSQKRLTKNWPEALEKNKFEKDDFVSNSKIRILLADDHAVMREGLTGILRNQPDLEVVAQAENGLEAIQMADQTAPDVILMDITMPEMDGIAATKEILKKHPRTCIIGLSMHDDPSIKEKMIRAGASSYVYKAAPSVELLQAIRMSVDR